MILKIFFFTLSFRYVCILYTKILAKKSKKKKSFHQFLWLHKKHQFPCLFVFRDVLMSSEGHVQIACTPCGSSIKSKSRNTWRCPLFPNGKSRPSKRDRLLSSWVMAESKVFVFIWRVTGAFLSQSPGHSGKTLRGKKKGATRQRPWLLREGQQMSGKGGWSQRSLTVLSWLRGFDPGTWGGEAAHAPTGRHEPSPRPSLPVCRPTPKNTQRLGGSKKTHYITKGKISAQDLHLAARYEIRVGTLSS